MKHPLTAKNEKDIDKTIEYFCNGIFSTFPETENPQYRLTKISHGPKGHTAHVSISSTNHNGTIELLMPTKSPSVHFTKIIMEFDGERMVRNGTWLNDTNINKWLIERVDPSVYILKHVATEMRDFLPQPNTMRYTKSLVSQDIPWSMRKKHPGGFRITSNVFGRVELYTWKNELCITFQYPVSAPIYDKTQKLVLGPDEDFVADAIRFVHTGMNNAFTAEKQKAESHMKAAQNVVDALNASMKKFTNRKEEK